MSRPHRLPHNADRAALRVGVLAVAATLILAACGSGAPSAAPTAEPTPAPGATAAPTPSATPAATPIADGDLAALYREIEDQVAELRELPAKERIEPVILSEDELRKRQREQFEKDNPADEVKIAEETLRALNLLPADADLGELYLDLMGSQVIGFYDTETKEMAIISRSGKVGALEKMTFAHEFTHALQDQSFGSENLGFDAVGEGDRSLGRLSLVEGDASLAMTLWLSKHLGPEELQELLQIDPEAQAQLEAMPAILRETLMFPYQQGLVFVNGIWARGGWEAVDRAYGRLPDSTEQVLHPEKYEAREKPVEVALDAAAVAAAMGDGWSGTPEDTLGEFQLSVWLRENGVKALDASAAAAGWGGDRLAYLRGPDGAHALVLRTAWDSAADADAFVAAAGTVVGDGDAPGTVVRAAPTEVVVVLASDGAALNLAVDAAELDLPD